MKEEQRLDETEEIEARAAMLLNPDSLFGERFEAVLTDMLKGQHISQTEPDEPGLYRAPTDNEEEEEGEY
jgi:hypothetical protein